MAKDDQSFEDLSEPAAQVGEQNMKSYLGRKLSERLPLPAPAEQT